MITPLPPGMMSPSTRGPKEPGLWTQLLLLAAFFGGLVGLIAIFAWIGSR